MSCERDVDDEKESDSSFPEARKVLLSEQTLVEDEDKD